MQPSRRRSVELVLRGASVSARDVTHKAINYCKIFNLKALKRKQALGWAFELLSDYGITLDVVDDADWLEATNGWVAGSADPVTLTIRVPNSTFELACAGERDALFVMLHELGHLMLGHQFSRPWSGGLHESAMEQQADLFAEAVLHELGFDVKQMSLGLS